MEDEALANPDGRPQREGAAGPEPSHVQDGWSSAEQQPLQETGHEATPNTAAGATIASPALSGHAAAAPLPFVAPSDLLRPSRASSARPVTRDTPMSPLDKEQINGLVSLHPPVATAIVSPTESAAADSTFYPTNMITGAFRG